MSMQTFEIARQKVVQLLGEVEDIGESVIRGERVYGGKCFATVYVDLADNVVGRAEGLLEFQERILGDEYFNSPGDLRWNNYIYIVAGPKSRERPDFQRAKTIIEADEDFARKRVVSEDELASVLGAAKYFKPNVSTHEFAIIEEWTKLLGNANIDGILDRPARTAMLARIGSGDAGSKSSIRKPLTVHASDKLLNQRWLSKLRIENFRPVHDGKNTFDFGQVTLITGPNGTGKTSLLEAIEFFYCGRNRRAHNGHAKLYGTLWTTDKELSATTDSSRLRARCLNWYNREEKNSANLLSSFSRYNFLDTDAAFRIATDTDPEELPEDLSRLIVGSDASQIWSYITKLTPEVKTAIDRASLYHRDAEKTLEGLQSKLKELQERPSEAKALSEAFRASLPLIGYRGALPTTPFVSVGETKPIQVAYAAVQVLLAAGPSFITLGSLVERSRAIGEINKEVESLDIEVKALTTRIRGMEEQAASYETWMKLLLRWAEYERACYSAVQDKYLRCRNLVDVANASMGALVNTEVPAIDTVYKSVRLEDALNEVVLSIQSSATFVASLEQISASFSQSASARVQKAQDLKTAVLAILKSGAPLGTCPVCKTDHGEAELAAHIERITSELAQPAELTALHDKLSAARENHKQWLTWKAFLENLQQIALRLSLPPSQTCGEIVEAFSAARRDLDQARSNLQSASEALGRLHEAGMSVEEYDSLRSSVIKISSLTDRPSDIAAVESQAKVYQSEAISIREQIPHLRVQTDTIVSRIGLKMKPLFENGWRTRTSVSKGIEAFNQLNQEIVALQKQRDDLLLYFQIGSEQKLVDVEATLAGALRAVNEAIQAAAREETKSAEISNLLQQIEKQKIDVNNHFQQLSRYQAAMSALKKLNSDFSLESATARSLHAIGQEINDAFVRIHSPNEYEYVGSEGVLLRSKDTQENWSLDKVSTGQRAAFALSVFLAVNRTAAKAPPVILIDDPVAHIDDLNALSFLDYLRDLTVTSKKQVFFATADARIAALFTRKFSFLGDNFKRIKLLREEQTE